MNNNEKSENKLSQKEKIRQRYKGVDFDELDVIPVVSIVERSARRANPSFTAKGDRVLNLSAIDVY